LRAAYLALADKEPKRCVVVDGRAPREVVAQRIWAAVEQRLHPGPRVAETAAP
jgi:dTMP kinase